MLNQHITDYLQCYVDSKKSPDHAVMLNGPWGAGKTWFIKEFVKDFTSTYEEVMKFFHVSLYGTKSIEDIDGELFRQAHPFLSSRSMIIGKAVAKGFMKGFLKIDLDGDGKEDFKIEPNDLKGAVTADDLEEIKPVLIFDDLERCPIDIIELLGYINHFVEIQGYKVIILAHEDALKKRWEKAKDGKTSHRYEEIKEKLVGKTFTVEPNVSAAISSFVDDIENEKSKVICKDNIEAIETIFKESTYNNLRHIKRGLWDYSLFVKNVSGNSIIMANDDFLSHMLKLFLIYTIEVRKGALTSTDLITDYILEATQEENNNDELKLNLSKYSCVEARSILISHKIWTYLLFSKGKVLYPEIEKSILKSPYFYSELSPDWKKIFWYRNLEDAEFVELRESVVKQFKECNAESVPVLLHIVGVLIGLSDFNLLDMEKDEIICLAKKNVQTLLDRGCLYDSESLQSEWDISSMFESYDGLGFQSSEQIGFKEVVDYIVEQQQLGKNKFIENESHNLLKQMGYDSNGFLHSVAHFNNDSSSFYDKPILKYISQSDFIDEFKTLDNKDKRTICFAFKMRYKMHFASSLIDEQEWLEELLEAMKIECENWKGKIALIHFAEMIKTIEVALENLTAAVTQNNEQAVLSTN